MESNVRFSCLATTVNLEEKNSYGRPRASIRYVAVGEGDRNEAGFCSVYLYDIGTDVVQ